MLVLRGIFCGAQAALEVGSTAVRADDTTGRSFCSNWLEVTGGEGILRCFLKSCSVILQSYTGSQVKVMSIEHTVMLVNLGELVQAIGMNEVTS